MTMTKEALIGQFEELLQQEDFKEIREKVRDIRDQYNKLVATQHKEAQEAFVAEGGEEANFVAPPADEWDEKLETLFAQYNEKKEAYRIQREEENARREAYRQQREVETQRRLGEQQTLLDELKEFVVANDVSRQGFDKIKAFQTRWKEIGKVSSDEGKALLSQYNHQLDLFFHNLEIARDLQRLDWERNLQAKQDLIKRAEELLTIEVPKELGNGIRKLQSEWKQIGPVLREKREEIYQQFKTITDQVYNRVQSFYGHKREQLEENLQAKLNLIERVNEINGSLPTSLNEWQARVNEVLKLQEQWKQTGQSTGNEEIWQTFRNTCDTFFEHKKSFYRELDGARDENKRRKVELCEKAEAMRTDTDWQRTSSYLIKLQREWKEIGPASRGDENRLWDRFRKACDAFFEAKKQHFSSQDHQQEDNLIAKQALMERLIAYEPTGDSDFDDLRNFSDEWVKIGFVPIKQKEALQKEYNRILDEKYAIAKKIRQEASGRTGGYGDNQGDNRGENRGSYGDNRSNNRSGGYGDNRGGDNRGGDNRGNNRRSRGNDGNNDRGDRGNRGYDNRTTASPYSDHPNRVEIEKVRTRLAQVQEEVARYENNMSFFGNAAKGNPLLAEVENKLNQLRQEEQTLQQNLKALVRPPAPVQQAEVSNETEVTAESETEVTAEVETEVSNETEVTAEVETEVSNETEVTAEVETEVSNETEVTAEVEQEVGNEAETTAETETEVTAEVEQEVGNGAETTAETETEVSNEPTDFFDQRRANGQRADEPRSQRANQCEVKSKARLFVTKRAAFLLRAEASLFATLF